MAGGLGTRLWPWSLQDRPKQLLPLFGDKSLLRMTWDRAAPLTSPDRVLLLTNRHLLERVSAEIPELPLENLVGEPKPCNSAPCVALAAALCERWWGPETVMVVLSADHYVGDDEAFRQALGTAVRVAQSDECLVTLGIVPTRPETGYGYLECERPVSELGNGESVPLVRFVEKPDSRKATEYLAGHRFLWNMGNFVWTCGTILAEFERQMPDLIARAREASSRERPTGSDSLDEFYLNLPEDLCTSVDYAIMEKASRIRAVPCRVPWDDVGSWPVLRRLRPRDVDDKGNLSVIRHLSIETTNTLVAGTESDNGVVVTLGVDGLVVVREGERVLIVPEDRVDLVKAVVPALREKGWDHLL